MSFLRSGLAKDKIYICVMFLDHPSDPGKTKTKTPRPVGSYQGHLIGPHKKTSSLRYLSSKENLKYSFLSNE